MNNIVLLSTREMITKLTAWCFLIKLPAVALLQSPLNRRESDPRMYTITGKI